MKSLMQAIDASPNKAAFRTLDDGVVLNIKENPNGTFTLTTETLKEFAGISWQDVIVYLHGRHISIHTDWKAR